MNLVTHNTGVVLRAAEADYLPDGDCWVAQLVGPHLGAELVSVAAVRIPPGRGWAPPDSDAAEYIAVVLGGDGVGTVGSDSSAMSRSDALYSPTGTTFSLTSGDTELTAYVWRSTLPPGSPRGTAPRRFNRLGNAETKLVGFVGAGQVESAAASTATMHFLFWPGTGSARLCLHCGIMGPGEVFNVHLHPESEEAFFVFEGTGQIYLHDRWVDVGPGDGVYAPPGILHGARNPQSGPGASRMVAFGGPTPFDPALYAAAGVSAEVG